MAEQFSNNIWQVVSNGFVTIGLCIGEEHGFFKVLAQQKAAISSEKLAELSHCKSRYVQEWLKIMVAAKIIEVDDEGKNYFLPEDHRPALRSEMVTYLAHVLPPLLGHHKQVMDVFKKDGPPGLMPKDTDEFIKCWEEHRPSLMQKLVPQIINCVEGLQKQLETGIEVVDVGCGRGNLICLLAAQFPNSKFTGLDVSDKCLLDAKEKANEARLKNVTFLKGDAANLPEDLTSKFDVVCIFDVLHDLPYAAKSSRELYRMCKPGGQLIVQEFYSPNSQTKDADAVPVLGMFSLYYCLGMSMSHAGSEEIGTCPGVDKLISLVEEGGFDYKGRGKLTRLGPIDIVITCIK